MKSCSLDMSYLGKCMSKVLLASCPFKFTKFLSSYVPTSNYGTFVRLDNDLSESS